MKERRRFKRFELFLKIALDHNTKDTLRHIGQLMNMSRFGLMASVAHPDTKVSSGDLIDIKIPLPDKSEAVMCEGAIKHVKIKNRELVIGIEIKSMDPGAKSDLLEQAYRAWLKKGDGHK